jgi:hypothetical protein
MERSTEASWSDTIHNIKMQTHAERHQGTYHEESNDRPISSSLGQLEGRQTELPTPIPVLCSGDDQLQGHFSMSVLAGEPQWRAGFRVSLVEGSKALGVPKHCGHGIDMGIYRCENQGCPPYIAPLMGLGAM